MLYYLSREGFMVERKVYLYSTDILVSSGKGGNGCVSFRREALVPKGGPDGGDGGRGGAVYLVASKKMETIVDFKHKRVFRAQNGKDGSGNDRTGAGGEDLIITIPLGTQIWAEGKMLFDLMDERPKLLLKGGKGGLGNQHFATPDLQTPYIATEGEPGKELTIMLVLKHLADIGVIGMPNAGKSTLVHRLSGAPVKIGDYAFSTIEPVLGVIKKRIGADNAELEDTSINKSLGIRKTDLLELELELLKPEVRKSKARLSEILADDFIEVGISGKIYDKQAILEALPQEEARNFKKITDFNISPLQEDLFLATYTLEEDAGVSVRSSLWREESEGYQLVMHRGALPKIENKYDDLDKDDSKIEKSEVGTEYGIANAISAEQLNLGSESGLKSDDIEGLGQTIDKKEESIANSDLDHSSSVDQILEDGVVSGKTSLDANLDQVFMETETSPTLDGKQLGGLSHQSGSVEVKVDPAAFTEQGMYENDAMDDDEPQSEAVAPAPRLIIADLPGLIEGSHRNVGLGHRFLQHLYRCKLLLHVVDGSDPNALDSFNTIMQEVELYDPLLLEKPQLVCISKADLALPEQLLELELQLRSLGHEAIILSSDYRELIERLFL